MYCHDEGTLLRLKKLKSRVLCNAIDYDINLCHELGSLYFVVVLSNILFDLIRGKYSTCQATLRVIIKHTFDIIKVPY